MDIKLDRTTITDKKPFYNEPDFQEKINDAIFRTTYRKYGSLPVKIPAQTTHGINGKFTDHLLDSGMYHNGSLYTTADRDRWVQGSRDWMEKLG